MIFWNLLTAINSSYTFMYFTLNIFYKVFRIFSWHLWVKVPFVGT